MNGEALQLSNRCKAEEPSSELAPPGPPAVGRWRWLQPLLLQKRGHRSPGRAALNEHHAVAPRRRGQTGGHGEALPSPRPGRSAAHLGRVLTQQSPHHRSPPRFLLSVELPSPALSTQAWPLPPGGHSGGCTQCTDARPGLGLLSPHSCHLVPPPAVPPPLLPQLLTHSEQPAPQTSLQTLLLQSPSRDQV